ncbi:MAG: protein-methionine-sulfoxide reductase heme-binding subunit MsrQ [Oscillochloridaceae bacterium]|nr:sulfoxide reductase heme-binding subunit YedZ [Chloroflexaceae bacterium]MDW8392389.1 protein-methionine-sulfoxide reductase heme-binding subunit MsrQ [Oscillochloridaceae bacterium]
MAHFIGLRRAWPRLAVHLALLPFALLIFDAATGRLSVNPIQDMTLRTGKAALALLMLTLACTPLNRLLGWKWAAALRRPLGLYSFLYVCLHLLVFAVADYQLDAALIAQAIAEKRYILAGLASFALLLPLALTSTRAAMRRLGRWWRPLHRLVYVAAALAVLHYLWLSKVWREPALWGVVLIVLLLARLPAFWPPRARRARQRFLSPGAQAPHPRISPEPPFTAIQNPKSKIQNPKSEIASVAARRPRAQRQPDPGGESAQQAQHGEHSPRTVD